MTEGRRKQHRSRTRAWCSVASGRSLQGGAAVGGCCEWSPPQGRGKSVYVFQPRKPGVAETKSLSSSSSVASYWLCSLDTNHSLSLSLSFLIRSVQSSSVAQSRLTLCNPVDCSMPGLPVYHQLAQTHVHGVGVAIQPSHSLSSPSPAFNLSQHQGLFK